MSAKPQSDVIIQNLMQKGYLEEKNKTVFLFIWCEIPWETQKGQNQSQVSVGQACGDL